jgi:predicted rRNA methylase YqxC with S4 and FtsJ domains
MGRHTKQQIKPKMQQEHKVLCYEYMNATSLEETNV